MIPTRRSALAGLAAAAMSPAAHAAPDAVAAIEARLKGRVGIHMLDTATGRAFGHRADERFALCSTFKAALAAAVLKSGLNLDETLRADSIAAVANSPITDAAKGGAMSIRALCAAAVAHSDNTAANLLLERLGGPAAVTAFFRGLGDRVTRLDRIEPALNENRPGDARDTTTPAAMTASLRTLLLGEVLNPASRQALTEWMLDERNGRRRIRAAVPAGWRVANKPGTSGDGAVNDIAVLWQPSNAPLVVSVYTNAPGRPLALSEQAIGEAVRAGLRALGRV